MSAAQKAEATRLYVPGVFGHKRVAQQLGVSTSTVRRWVDPAHAERDRVLSREAKRRRTGVCERCGGVTQYGGSTNRPPVSRFCLSCAAVIGAEVAVARRGTGSCGTRILAFLEDGPKRYMQIHDLLDLPRKSDASVLLGRLLRYGLIERPSRGLYQLASPGEEKTL